MCIDHSYRVHMKLCVYSSLLIQVHFLFMLTCFLLTYHLFVFSVYAHAQLSMSVPISSMLLFAQFSESVPNSVYTFIAQFFISVPHSLQFLSSMFSIRSSLCQCPFSLCFLCQLSMSVSISLCFLCTALYVCALLSALSQLYVLYAIVSMSLPISLCLFAQLFMSVPIYLCFFCTSLQVCAHLSMLSLLYALYVYVRF